MKNEFPMENDEKDVGCLERLSGHTYDIIYNLLFTTERAIAMIVRHPLDVSAKPTVAGLFLGGGRAKRSEQLERMKMMEDRLHLYKEQTYDEIVSGHRFNFEIPYHKVSRVELTRGIFSGHLTFHLTERLNGKSRIRFTISRKQVPEARRILDQVLPAKKIPG